MDGTTLELIIRVKNEVDKTLDDISNKVSSFSEETEAGTTKASGGFSQFAGAIATGALAARVAEIGFVKIKEAISAVGQSVVYASRINELGLAMNVVANNADITAQQVGEMRDKVAEQNITTEASNILMTRLIQNQLDYTKANELATAAQNMAVVSGRSSSETLELITQAISSGQPFILQSLGLTEHLTEIYQKYGGALTSTGEDLDATQRKQAVMNYVLAEGEKFTGLYEKSMTNAYKKMGSLKDKIGEVSYEFGQSLEPALKAIVDQLYEWVKGTLTWFKDNREKISTIAKSIGKGITGIIASIKTFFERNKDIIQSLADFLFKRIQKITDNIKILAGVLQIAGGGVEFLVRTFYSGFKIIDATLKGNFVLADQLRWEWVEKSAAIQEGMNQAAINIYQAFDRLSKNSYQTIDKFWSSVSIADDVGWQDRIDTANSGSEALVDIAKESEIAKKQAEETEKYQEQLADRVANFEESLRRMIWAHQDKVEQIMEQIQEEGSSYNKSLEDRAKSFQKSLDKMLESHLKTLQKIKDREEDANKSYQKNLDERTEKKDEEVQKIEDKEGQRYKDLLTTYEQELEAGKDKNSQYMLNLKGNVDLAKIEYEKALEKAISSYNDDTAEYKYALDEKLTDLQKEKLDENTEHEKSIAERTLEYAQDVADLKVNNQEKIDALKISLGEELDIIKRNNGEQFGTRRQMYIDDVDELKKKHLVELNEMALQHQKKLDKIRTDAYIQGSTSGSLFDSGVKAWTPVIASEGAVAGIEYAEQFYKNAKQVLDNGKVCYLPGYGGNSGKGGGGVDYIKTPNYFGDFISRPGQNPIKFSPDDNVLGFKSGGSLDKVISNTTENNSSIENNKSEIHVHIHAGMMVGDETTMRRVFRQGMDLVKSEYARAGSKS